MVGGRNREDRGEEEWYLAFGIDFQSWVLAKEKGRKIEKREEKENGVWRLGLIFRVGFFKMKVFWDIKTYNNDMFEKKQRVVKLRR